MAPILVIMGVAEAFNGKKWGKFCDFRGVKNTKS